MKSKITIVKPGVFTTLQDGGRVGYRSLGVPTSGYLDPHAAYFAQWLAGNKPGSILIEMLAVGGAFCFEDTAIISITGGDMRPSIQGILLPAYETITIEKNTTLVFNAAANGQITYLAVAGEIAAQNVMGSSSTYVTAKFGGIHGKPLQKNDVLTFENVHRKIARKVPEHLQPKFARKIKIRIIKGPHWHHADDKLTNWIGRKFTKSAESNRMGLRLTPDDADVPLVKDIISTPVVVGAVQLPTGGNPIVVMADGQTTGGYPHIATVVAVDIPRIAQLPPGGVVQFELIEMERATALLKYRHAIWEQLDNSPR